jgi:hypothetical protein
VFPVRRLAPDGMEAWTQVIERGYKGYVAKDVGDSAGREGEPADLNQPAGLDGSRYLATIWSLILS